MSHGVWASRVGLAGVMGAMAAGVFAHATDAAMAGVDARAVRQGRAEPLAEAAAAIGGLSGADRAVLVGVATRGERARVSAAARAALSRVDAAEEALGARARVIEQLIPARPGDEATLRQELGRVRRDELSARVPLLRGRAALLFAATAGDAAERAAALETALATLRKAEPATTAGEGLRRVSLAHALGLAGGAENRREAAELLDAVLELPVGEDAEAEVPAALVLEAALGRWLLDDAGTAAGLMRVLDAEAVRGLTGGGVAASLAAQAEAKRAAEVAGAAGARDGRIDAAVEILAGLGLAGDDAAARQAAAERIDGLLMDWEPAAWTAAGRFAVAMAAAGRGETAAALAGLDALAREGGAGAWAARSAWIAANLRLASTRGEDWMAAVDGLLALLRAGEWAERARRVLAAAEQRWAGASLDAGAEIAAAAREARGRALRGLLADATARNAAGEADARRAALIEWLIDGAAAEPSVEALREAGGLDDVLTSPPAGLRARLGRAMLEAARRGGAEQRLTKARLGFEWAMRRGEPASALRRALAEALLEGGQAADAARVFAELDAGGGLDAAGRLGLARALAQSGDAEGAVRTLRGLVAGFDGQAGARPAVFWEAWADLLELLAAKAGEGAAERRGEIRLRLRQLELIDPALGGGEAARRLRAVAK